MMGPGFTFPPGSGGSVTGGVKKIDTYSPDVAGNLILSSALRATQEGAKANGRRVQDGVVVSGSNVFNSPSANFLTTMKVGDKYFIPYAGDDVSGTKPCGQCLVGVVTAINSNTQFVGSVAATISISGTRTLTDVGTTNSQSVLNSTTGFNKGDIGKMVTVPNGGLPAITGGTPFSTMITTLNTANQVGINRRCLSTNTNQSVTIPGATIIWGTDDQAALQAAIVKATAAKVPLLLEYGETGCYILGSSLIVNTNTNVQGYGKGFSQIWVCGTGPNLCAFTTIDANDNPVYGPNTFISKIRLKSFTIDSTGHNPHTYTSSNKGIYIKWCYDLEVDDLEIINTPATSVGCDYLPRGRVTNCNIRFGGKCVPILGGNAGGAGIGIGTGSLATENILICGNHVEDCGAKAIFSETQVSKTTGIYSMGTVISNNTVQWSTVGISDRGEDKTLITGNTVMFCGKGITTEPGFGGTGSTVEYSKECFITGNVVIVPPASIGIYLDHDIGSVKVSNNLLKPYGNGASYGIQYSPTLNTATTVGDIEISNNQILEGNTNGFLEGIMIAAGTSLRSVRIANNTIVNTGLSNATPRAGIQISATSITKLTIIHNHMDERRSGTSRFMGWGTRITGTNITRLVYLDNDDTYNMINAPDVMMGGIDVSGAGTISTSYFRKYSI